MAVRKKTPNVKKDPMHLQIILLLFTHCLHRKPTCIDFIDGDWNKRYVCSYQIQWNDPVTSQIEGPRPQAPIINLSSKVTLCTCTCILRIPAADSVCEEAHKTAIKYSLVPSPYFSRVGRRARFARGRKNKGLVHTVCACVKKSQISVTSGHDQDIFGYFCHN